MKCLQKQQNNKVKLNVRDTFLYTLHFYPVLCLKCLQICDFRDTWRHLRDTWKEDKYTFTLLQLFLLPSKCLLLCAHSSNLETLNLETLVTHWLVKPVESMFYVLLSVSNLILTSSICVSQVSLNTTQMETLPAFVSLEVI